MTNAHELFNQAGIYLQQALGEDLLQEGAWEKGAQLPRYLAQTYDMGKARLAGIEVLLMANKDGVQALPALLKQRALIQKEAGVPVIWVGDALQAYARKEMVARRMPFIIPFKQAYLPPLGVEFQERALATRADAKEKLHVATQVFLINTLLGNLPDTLNPKEIAMYLGYSLMTMTRIKSELMEHGWLDAQAYKSERIWRLNLEGGALWKAIKPYLQTPVRKRLWIRNPNPHIEGLPLAGLSALAEQTMLGEPPNIVRAIGELDWRKLERELDADKIVPEAIDGSLELEVWRYAPQRIKAPNAKEGNANNGIVDPYSLFLSLEAMDDDRVQVALKELLRGIN
jgi:DNA-binding MarR family transcriptional regulator